MVTPEQKNDTALNPQPGIIKSHHENPLLYWYESKGYIMWMSIYRVFCYPLVHQHGPTANQSHLPHDNSAQQVSKAPKLSVEEEARFGGLRVFKTC